MFARVSTYRGGTDGLLEGFRRTTEPLAQLDGFERAYFLTDAESGRSMTVTVWDSQAAVDASGVGADGTRACHARLRRRRRVRHGIPGRPHREKPALR